MQSRSIRKDLVSLSRGTALAYLSLYLRNSPKEDKGLEGKHHFKLSSMVEETKKMLSSKRK